MKVDMNKIYKKFNNNAKQKFNIELYFYQYKKKCMKFIR